MTLQRWLGGLMVVAGCMVLPNGVSAQPAAGLAQPPSGGAAQNPNSGRLGQSPSVRVVNQPAAVRSMPSTKRGEVMMSAVPGTVLEVLDSQEGWYWVVLARDENGTRRAGWIRAQDVEFVSANEQSLEMRALSAKIDQLQREIEALKNNGDASAPQPQPAVESPALVKARALLDARQREYDAAVKAAQPSSAQTSIDPAPQKPQSAPTQKPPSPPTQKPPSPRVQKSQSTPAQRPQSMHGFTPVSADTPRFDVFAGYAPLWDTTDSITYPLGWVASVGRHVNNRIAIAGEIGGSYKSVSAFGTTVATTRVHTFAAGPQFWGRTGRVMTFGQLLGGVAVGNSSVLGYGSSSSTGLAVLPGFGGDIPVAHNLGVRVGGELGFLHSSSGWSNDFRLMTGVVLTGGAR